VTGTALALKPPIPKGGVVLVWVYQTCSHDVGRRPRIEACPGRGCHLQKWTDATRWAVLLPMRIHMQCRSAELTGRRYLAVKPILFMS